VKSTEGLIFDLNLVSYPKSVSRTRFPAPFAPIKVDAVSDFNGYCRKLQRRVAGRACGARSWSFPGADCACRNPLL